MPVLATLENVDKKRLINLSRELRSPSLGTKKKALILGLLNFLPPWLVDILVHIFGESLSLSLPCTF